MWGKLIVHSFRRDAQKKWIAFFAVVLATGLATFLLNWSLNLGDRFNRDLRSYGANILITPVGESLALAGGALNFEQLDGLAYLKYSELPNLQKSFWKNQIVAYVPLLPQQVHWQDGNVVLVGTEFGQRDPLSSFPRIMPTIALAGKWPRSENDAVVGRELAQRFGWKVGDEIALNSVTAQSYRITGILQSGGAEDHEIFADIRTVQQMTNHPDSYKQLLVSAMVSAEDQLYRQFQQNPKSLSPSDLERYSCRPYITSVAQDLSKTLSDSEARILRQISKADEKTSARVNWLMFLVTLAGLSASSLTMASTTTAMILQRRKELALMKAIGSSPFFIVLYLLSELLILAIAGSLAGYGLGTILSTALSRTIFQSSFDIKWIVLPLVGFIGFLIIVCGSSWPLRRALALDPAEALKDL
jgi:putative ABC transport system permease protein